MEQHTPSPALPLSFSEFLSKKEHGHPDRQGAAMHPADPPWGQSISQSIRKAYVMLRSEVEQASWKQRTHGGGGAEHIRSAICLPV